MEPDPDFPERSYPDTGMGRMLKINGVLLALIFGLFVLGASQKGGSSGAAVLVLGLLLLGVPLNLVLAARHANGRAAYLVAAVVYGFILVLICTSLAGHSTRSGHY